MLIAALRRLSFVSLIIVASAFLAGHAHADLVWTPQAGWEIQGGAFSGLATVEGRNAIDLMNKARAAEEKGSYGSALTGYEKVAKKYPNSIWAPEAYFRSAQVHLLRKQYERAFADYQQIIARYPNVKRFDEVIGDQYHIAAMLLNGVHTRMLWGLLPGFPNREQGVAYLEQVLVDAPYSKYAPLALMEIAAGHQWLGNPEEAMDALDRFINNYPQNVLAPDAYLRLAQMNASLVEGPYYDQASTNESITYYQDFMILFPGDHNVGVSEKGLADMKKMLAESKIKIADFYFYKRSNFVAARVFYNEAITSYPDSEVAGVAKKRLALVDAAAEKARNAPPPRKKFLGIF